VHICIPSNAAIPRQKQDIEIKQNGQVNGSSGRALVYHL
jgi:hypothetical protein